MYRSTDWNLQGTQGAELEADTMTISCLSLRRFDRPLDETLVRLNAFNPHLRLERGVPEASGYRCASDLLTPGGLEGPLALGSAAYPDVHATLIANSFFNEYSWMLVATGVIAWLTELRVPDLSLENIALHLGRDGRVDGLALRSGRFATLTGDAGADHPDAVLFGDVDALRRQGLMLPLVAHLTALVASTRRGPSPNQRRLWKAIADRFTTILVWTTRRLGLEHRCPALHAALLADLPPLEHPGVLQIEHRGRSTTVALRAACCYSDQFAGGTQCAACPRLPLDERIRRLRAQLAAEESK